MKFKGALKKVMETFVYRECVKTLDTTPIEDLNVEKVMATLQPNLDSNEKAADGMAKAGFTEDDIRDVVKNVVPKLLKEKQRRLRFSCHP